MNRHRSTSRSARAAAAAAARESESRQPEEDGRRSSTSRLNLLGNSNNNPPRTPRSTASTANTTAASTVTGGVPPAPHSAPPASTFPKTRCYRLNLEKPFDIRNQKSPLGRDYSGPPVRDSDLPPAQGPVEYFPPPHLCSKEDLWRRHSFGGYGAGSHNGGASTPSELMANLQVSVSEESNDNSGDPTSIAITTARIFRGIVVDRNGVITSMNSRAMRSQRGKNGGKNENKMGEKSRQAAKIDKAKDLIDEVVENGGGGGMGDEENDPTKIVSLFVMGEYEDLNDLVRDGSKKLRDCKSLTDEAILQYNRPRQFPPGMHPNQIAQREAASVNAGGGGGGGLQPMAVSPAGGMSPASSPYQSPASSPAPQYAGAPDPGNMSPTGVASNVSSPSNLRKRVFSADKSSRRGYKQSSSRSNTTPRIKENPRDPNRERSRSARGSGSKFEGGAAGGAASPTDSRAASYHRGNSGAGSQHNSSTAASHHTGHSANAQQRGTGVHGMLNCNPGGMTPGGGDASSANSSAGGGGMGNADPRRYFQQQCNFFPGNSDWTEALGFSVNSLWNCGANGGHLSPTMSPHSASSPTSSHNRGTGGGGGHQPPATGGGVYHGSGAAGAAGYHHSGGAGYHHPSQGGNAGYGGAGGGYNNYSSQGGGGRYVEEGRNPSHGGYGSGYGRTGTGVRDTVVM